MRVLPEKASPQASFRFTAVHATMYFNRNRRTETTSQAHLPVAANFYVAGLSWSKIELSSRSIMTADILLISNLLCNAGILNGVTPGELT
jgi:hypothetical protein